MSEEISELLRSLYYDTSNSVSFSGVNKLYSEAKKYNSELKLAQVKDWLSGELTYTLHKPIIKKFSRNKILVNRIDQQWEGDLVDMREFAKYNDNFNYILTIIDCFSKYSFAVPLKNKSGKEIIKALKLVFEKRKCALLRTDRGTEFCNADVRRYLNKENVVHFTSHDQEVKCAIVERFNRTLKGKMFKYFTANGSRRYLGDLPNFLIAYSNSKHRTIKMAPSEVNKENEKLVFKNIYGVNNLREAIINRKSNNNKILIKPGDKVRKKYSTKPFDKGYYPNWTDQIFTIVKTIKGDNQPVFRIKDYAGNLVNQRFYPQELQKITENLHRIEKVLKTRVRKAKTEYFVKWINYPSTYNSWVTNIENLNGRN